MQYSEALAFLLEMKYLEKAATGEQPGHVLVVTLFDIGRGKIIAIAV